MNLSLWQILGTILLFGIIIGTGYWMSHLGKPYNTGIFTIHKLISLGAIAILAVISVKANKAGELTGINLAGIIATGVFFLGTLVTGGMLSVDKTFPAIVQRLHQILPFLTTISAGVTLFLFR